MPPGFPRKITMYRSEVIKKNLNPVWKPFELSAEMLGGFDTSFDVLVYDFDDDGGIIFFYNFLFLELFLLIFL